MKCKKCGKQTSSSGKPFTAQSLAQHVKDAHTERDGWEEGDPTFELTDMVADDNMPDGAYFALAHELGELW